MEQVNTRDVLTLEDIINSGNKIDINDYFEKKKARY